MLVRQFGKGDSEICHRQFAVMGGLFIQPRRVNPLGVRLLALVLAPIGIKGVAQDREQPGAHIGAGLEAFDIGPGLDDRVLHHVIGQRHIACQADRKGAQRRQMCGQRITWVSGVSDHILRRGGCH